MDNTHESVKLSFTIYKYSSYSSNYVPENIMVNNPTDQKSRWFTDSDTSSQFIMLKLDSPALVETITFGKYIKAHVSDLKKFKILGGTDPRTMSELLSAGLKHDNLPETFRLRHKTKEGLWLPVTYIKILPIKSWGPAYNYTIWFVELHGKNQEDLIKNAIDTINLRKEEEAVRILLKHLRRRRYKDAFEALSRESGVRLEGDLQARLWTALVENGDYELAEHIIDEAVTDGEFDWYMSWQSYTPRWRQLSACSVLVEEGLSRPPATIAPPVPDELPCADRGDQRAPLIKDGQPLNGDDDFDLDDASVYCNKPGPRGGHQLVVDSSTSTLYLFGGWNGTEDLDDLWSYSVNLDRWTLLCPHSGDVGGPSPRSCHKMVLDPVERRLYTLGRYLDSVQRVPENMKSELYTYDIGTGEWALACEDSAAAGGPRLLFDHQMCIDVDARTIYVFGGRILPANTEEVMCPAYSGLFAYYMRTGTWQALLTDHAGPAPQPRVGHSMLFHPVERRLYIFAGQRNKEQLLDLWWYDVERREAGSLGAGAARRAPPAAGFTQRATLLPHSGEVAVLAGMSKEKDKRVYNTLWVFSLKRLTWTCVYRNETVSNTEPRPRFAHQLVYDPISQVHYLFGGNPGNPAMPRLRLDDLWALELLKPSLNSVVGQVRAAIREAKYRELAADEDTKSAAVALHYLRHNVREVLDHSDPKQVERFQKLATLLFVGGERAVPSGCGLGPAAAARLARRRARATPSRPQLAVELAAVLGADETLLEPTAPFEEVVEPPPESWDVGEAGDDAGAEGHVWSTRAARTALYDRLCGYFRPSRVPPQADVEDLVKP